MIKETIKNGVYTSKDGNKVLLTITSLGDNIYRAVNNYYDIVARVTPLDDYRTSVQCISYKRKDKIGRYRKTTKLLSHTLGWLDYMLEKIGFIREKKSVNYGG